MKNRINLLLIFLGLLSLLAVEANANRLGNPMSTPMGFSEMARANTSVGVFGSDASAFYNPAAMNSGQENGLRYIGGLQVNIESWTLAAEEAGVDNATSFIDVTPNFALVKDFGNWSLGLLLIQELNRNLLNEVSESSGTISTTTLLDIEEKSFLAGGSVSYRFNKKFSLGLTVFLDRYGERRITNIKQTDSSAVSDFISIERNDRNVANVFPVFGAMMRWTDYLSTGLRVQIPGAGLQGDVDHLSAVRGTVKSQAVNTEISELFDGEQSIPLDVVLGNSVRLGRHRLSFDLGVQFATDVTTIDAFDSQAQLEEVVATKTTLRYGIAYDWQISDNWGVLAGLQINPSTITDTFDELPFQATLDTTEIDLFTGSFGISHKYKTLNLLLGGYFSSGEFKHLDHVPSTSVSRTFDTTFAGIFFALSSVL